MSTNGTSEYNGMNVIILLRNEMTKRQIHNLARTFQIVFSPLYKWFRGPILYKPTIIIKAHFTNTWSFHPYIAKTLKRWIRNFQTKFPKHRLNKKGTNFNSHALKRQILDWSINKSDKISNWNQNAQFSTHNHHKAKKSKTKIARNALLLSLAQLSQQPNKTQK